MIQTAILIDGARIFRIISGVTCGDLANQRFLIDLEVQQVNTTLTDDATEEWSKKKTSGHLPSLWFP